LFPSHPSVVARYSHSVPTRRSSDLVIQLQDGSGNPVGQANVAVGVKIQSGGGTLGGTTSATTGANGQAVFNNLSIAGTVGPRTLDRKSTRLNSSHEWISYAVFCLKK